MFAVHSIRDMECEFDVFGMLISITERDLCVELKVHLFERTGFSERHGRSVFMEREARIRQLDMKLKIFLKKFVHRSPLSCLPHPLIHHPPHHLL